MRKKTIKNDRQLAIFDFISAKCHGLSLCESSHFVLFAWSSFFALLLSDVISQKFSNLKWPLNGHFKIVYSQKLIRSLADIAVHIHTAKSKRRLLAKCNASRRQIVNFFRIFFKISSEKRPQCLIYVKLRCARNNSTSYEPPHMEFTWKSLIHFSDQFWYPTPKLDTIPFKFCFFNLFAYKSSII